jgi:hypothetical protein
MAGRETWHEEAAIVAQAEHRPERGDRPDRASSATRSGCGTFKEAAAFRRITEPESVIFEMSKAVMQTVADYVGQFHVAEKAKLKKFIATSPLLQPFDTDNLLDIFEHNSAATSAISLAAALAPSSRQSMSTKSTIASMRACGSSARIV